MTVDLELNDPLAQLLRGPDANLSDVSVMAGGREFRLEKWTIVNGCCCHEARMETHWLPLDELVKRYAIRGVWRHRLRLRLARLRWLRWAV